jgi:protein-tyrosine-phosphatase
MLATERQSYDGQEAGSYSLHGKLCAQPDGGGLLRHDAGGTFDVESAGTKPTSVRPEAVTVMRELGIDISRHRSKHVGEFEGQRFDYIITVCDNAREACPVFQSSFSFRLGRNCQRDIPVLRQKHILIGVPAISAF